MVETTHDDRTVGRLALRRRTVGASDLIGVTDMTRDTREANPSVSTAQGALVSIDFYDVEQLPGPLKAEAERQGRHLRNGLVAVKTFVASPPQFEFDEVGSTPQEIKTYYEGLAQADGVNLDELAKKTLSGE